MAAPKIKYDIEAAVTGTADATKLAGELRGLGDVLEGPLQKSARDAAAALEALGAKQRALEAFGALKRETTQLSTALGAASATVDRLGTELPQAAASTQAFATAERAATAAVQQTQAGLASQSAALKTVRQDLAAASATTTQYRDTAGQLRDSIKAGAAAVKEKQAALKAAAQESASAAGGSQALVAAEKAAAAALAQAKAELVGKREALRAMRPELDAAAAKSAAYSQTAATLRAGIKAGNAELQAQQAALRGSAQATAQAENAEKALRSEYDLAVASAAKLSAQVRVKNAALAQSREAMAALGVSTQNLAQTERTLKTAVDQVRTAVGGLAPAYQAAANASSASAQQQLQHHRTVRDGVSEIGTQLQKIQQIAMVAVGGGFLGGMVKDLAKTADEFKNLQARIRLATGEGAAFDAAFKDIAESALRTGSTLESTGTLFAKLAKAGVEAGKSLQVAQLEALGLTETINQSIQLSGGSADSAKAAVIQLIQGLQSGVLRGEEFNSVMEQAPRLAQALSDGLGVTTGKLRELAGQGKLTADTVMGALQGQADVVAAEFAKLPNTVGVALQNLSTQWLMYVGAADNGMLSSSNAAKLIDGLSKNLDTLVTTLTVAGKIWGSLKIAALAADLALWGQRTLAATAAVEANTAATAVNTAGARANAAATAAMTAAQTAAAAALAAAAAAQGVSGAAAAGAAAQVSLLAQAKRAALAAGAALTAGVVGTIGVLGGMTTAAGAAATAMRGLAAAKNAAVTAGAGLMGLLGGPAGLLVLTAVFAKDIGELAAKLVLWAKGQDNVEQSAAKLAKAEDELRKKTEAATLAREKQRQADLAAADARQGLTAQSKALILEFDKLIAKGDSAAAAIAAIGKDFDLSTQPGILNAISVLDKLVADGKITAQQFNDAWTGALKGVDLGEFQVRFGETMAAMQRDAEYAARAVENAIAAGVKGVELDWLKARAEGALQAVAKEAERTAQVVQATLAEAVRRTGLDMASISGGMSKASISAMNDINVIVQNLDGLRAKGIDTGNVLSISIGKAIDTANSQQAIDALKSRIESLREALGDKLTDGLLDQATAKSLALKDAVDKALPGINSAREAMQELGVDANATTSQISAGFKTATAAVDVLVAEFDALKERGVNATAAITTGLSKMLSEAKNQTDLDALTEKVKSLRDVLGATVTKGFLEEAAKKALALKDAVDAATPGINSTREAIKTLGIDTELASSKMSAGFKTAGDAVGVLAKDFSGLRQEGVNATEAITLGLNKMLSEAKNQADLDALKAKVEELRGVLGNTVADGFLEQAAKKTDELKAAMDEATPGINSAAEAFKELGITSDKELKQTAATAKEAFEAIKNSGTASPREISEAWKAMAEASIAANDGVADAAITSGAAAQGFAIEVDDAGKASVKSLGEVKEGFEKVDYAAQMAGKSVEELQAIKAEGWNIAEDMKEAADIQNAATNALTNAWRSSIVEADEYYSTLFDIYKKLDEFKFMGPAALEKAIWGASTALKELDAQQQAVERSSGDAAGGLASLEDRLLELNGTEEQIATRRKERDEAEVQQKLALLRLDLRRAEIMKDTELVTQLNAEISAYNQQLRLIEQIAAKEKQNRDTKRREEEAAAKERAAREAKAAKETKDREDQSAKEAKEREAQAARDAQERDKREARSERERQQREAKAAQDSATKDARASAPPAGASATYVSNVNIQGIGKAELKFADASSQRQTEDLLRQLAQAKGASQ